MFKFNPFEEKHLALFQSWLQEEHIKPFWQEPEDPAKLKRKFLKVLPERGIHAFVIEDAETNLIGYIQYYEASQIGGGWWENESPGTYGIDLLIGPTNKVGRGLGPTVINAFTKFVCSRERNVVSFIIDPAPENLKAVRAFEKAGFVKEREIVTPNGPSLLMRYLLPRIRTSR